MLEAEHSGAFNVTDSKNSFDHESVSEPDQLAKRLQDLGLAKPLQPERPATQSSRSRPLTVEDEDLDLDLELDENIDTTVS